MYEDLGILPELCVRVHDGGSAAVGVSENGSRVISTSPFDVLWTRKNVSGSPLAEHVATARLMRSGGAGRAQWSYDPEAARRAVREAPAGLGIRFEEWSRACSEMTEHACALLAEINRVRSGGHGRRIWQAPVEIGNDSAAAILARARANANHGRTTKSNAWFCTNPRWAEVMDEFGLAGIASFPVVAMGSWWMAQLVHDYRDWRQDYLSMLGYSFYFEYNLDHARFGKQRAEQMLQELNYLWDMPGLSDDLRVRRLHMNSSMAFFDTKRKQEATAHRRSTDGLTAWVHGDRDWWRDFKAQDSGGWAHYLSFGAGDAGRDDMMLSGLTNDWIDLGPDLRNDECNQSVLAMTRGSVSMKALLECYERSVWMINAQLATDGTVKPERWAGCMSTIGTCMWEICSHRHDLWRYYLIGVDSCAAASKRDLYRACQLADCYTSDFEPCEPVNVSSLRVPRRSLSYEVFVAGERYTGEVALHTAVCDAVEHGVLPVSVVTYAYVVPILLRDGTLTPSAFLAYMDSGYCENFITVMQSALACEFSDPYCHAIASLTMEQWWCGIYFAIGLGSLIEAQPGRVANDRIH